MLCPDVVDTRWLVDLFTEAGLEPDQAEASARVALGRLLRRQRPARGVRRTAIVQHLVRDPLISVNRIIGRGDEGLPLYDPETGRLSVTGFSDVLAEAGLDPVVAMAFAKVVAEAFEPAQLFEPVWRALGEEGDVDLEALRRADWTPLREAFADELPADERPDFDDMATQTVRAKPRARPPSKS